MELRTLKDINYPRLNYKNLEIYKQNIRQEAIKWVKEMKEAFILNYETVNIGGIWFTHSGLSGAIAILTHTNNLTEEDLK